MLLHKLGTLICLVTALTACATGDSASGGSVWTSPLPPLMTPTEDERDTRAIKTQPPLQMREVQTERRIRRAERAAEAERLLQAAEDAEGYEQQTLLLLAAEQAHAAGRNHLAAEALDRLTELAPLDLEPAEQLRLTLIQAEMGLYADRPLTLLSALPRPALDHAPAQAARIWRLRSEAYLALGQTLPATQALVRRELALRNPAAIQANRDLIWRTLRSVPPSVLDARQLAAADPITRGWISLAQVMLDLWLSPSELTAATNAWERQYPGHPARSTVLAARPVVKKQRRRIGLNTDGRLNKIALLLPLTGTYGAAATAVRDGFMVGYYARPQPRPDILVYDTGADPTTVQNLARQAVNAGADILVGPLTKEGVQELATASDIRIPVLTLNYLEAGVQAPAHYYQFGLSPEDEARQVAARALRDGHFRALALVPRSDWGLRTLSAFNDELFKLGGNLVEYMYYNPEDRDFSAPITQLLRYDRARAAAIDAAQKRRRTRADTTAASEMAGIAEITPLSAIRQDMDFIFLASKPEQARLIRPQLRFYRASAIPVYATSHVYTGSQSPQQDLDLDGIQFGDAPWTLAPAGAMAVARDEVARLWPANHARYPRLYAMGYDAYALANQLGKGNLRSDFGFPGATGLLTLESDGRISRGLQWARFGGGKPRLLSDGAVQPLGIPDGAFQ